MRTLASNIAARVMPVASNCTAVLLMVMPVLLAAASCGGRADPATLLSWTRGADEHRGTLESGSDMFLLTVPAGTLPTRGTPVSGQCVRASAFLPGPDSDPRVFLVVDGRLYASSPGAPTGGSSELPGLPPTHAITHLLAFDRRASPVQILALVKPVGADDASPWLLQVGRDRIISARPARDLPGDRQAFFDRFHAPRCQRRDQRCLQLARSDGSLSLLEQSRRGSAAQRLQTLGDPQAMEVRDVAWGSGKDAHNLYLLAGCSTGARPALWARGDPATDRRARELTSTRLVITRAEAPLRANTRASQTCARASSLLPGPPADRRVFYVVDGRLAAHALPGAAGAPPDAPPDAPVEMPGLARGLVLEDLLAYVRDSSSVKLLAMVRRARASAAEPWILTVGTGRVISAEPARTEPALLGRDAFFDKFHTPRCQRGDRDCVRVEKSSAGQFSLYRQSVRGPQGKRAWLGDLGGVRVADAAWGADAHVRPDGDKRARNAGKNAEKTTGTLYLLVDCDARLPSPR